MYFFMLCALQFACSSSEFKDIVDAIDPPRKTIDTTKLGINAFANDSRFGSIPSQFNEVKNTLRLNSVRILFAWNDAVQPTPQASPNFSFYDNILAGIPAGVDALVVLTGVPSWMSNSANWDEGNPRTTFVERWVRPVVARYGGNGRVSAWEIWNEPNMVSNADNTTLQLSGGPANYVEMLARAYSVSKDLAPSKKVVSASTTAINQNFPGSLDYNKSMQAAGAENFLDIWGIHYYGKQFENVARPEGVGDFLNGLTKPIWVTESGEQGVNKQLAYGEQTWPFLLDEIGGIERIYIYQFTEATPPESTYGLRNLSQTMPVSDLYVYLRDRQ